MKLSDIKKNPWPYGLVAFFVVFISYIVGFIIFASRQQMDLVREDYYDQEIRFQQQIDRMKRTEPALASASVDYDRAGGLLKIRVPSAAASGVSGEVSFYRPSDATLDNAMPLGLDAVGRQNIDVRALAGGLWKVRVQWKTAGQDYYFEKPVIIKPATS